MPPHVVIPIIKYCTVAHDNGMMAQNTLQPTYISAQLLIYHDMVRTESWGLLHQPSALTYVHHDVAGQHTWVLNISGYKSWFVFQLKQEHHSKPESEHNHIMLDIYQVENQLASDAFKGCHPNISTLAWSWSYSGQGKCCKYSLASPCLMLIQHAGLCCLTPQMQSINLWPPSVKEATFTAMGQ